jgi:intracellular septation protein
MKFLFDIFPIFLFFIAFKFWGIYVATGVAIAASVLQIIYLFLRKKKIEYTNWLNVVIIVVFGGLTLLLHNEIFIKWKPTILYALFAIVLFGGDMFYKKNLVRAMISSTLELPEAVWKKLNWIWIGFFAALAILNIVIAYTFSTDIWVDFKLFGLVGLTIVFVVAQSVWLAKYVLAQEK